MNKKRILWIDISKAILIVLVVAGHSYSNNNFHNFLSCFYMPCFFILSGCTYSDRRSFSERLKRRVKNLLVPYFIFSMFLICVSLLRRFITRANYSLIAAITSVVLPYSGRVGGSVYQLWFLPCLFLAQTNVDMLVGNNKNVLKIMGGGTWILMFICGTFLPKTSILMTASVAIGFILIGKYSKEKIEALDGNFIMLLSGGTLCFIYMIHCLILSKNIDYSSCNFGIFPLFLISSLAGSVYIILLSKKLDHSGILQFIGKNSLHYYGLHFLVLSVVGVVCEHFIECVFFRESIVFLLTLVGTTIIVVLCCKMNGWVKCSSVKGKKL